MLEEKEQNNRKEKRGVRLIAILLSLIGFTILILTYYPIIKSYIEYRLHPFKDIPIEITTKKEKITKNITEDTEVIFLDSNFGIYIPKIKANASVIANVDPFNEVEYINALYKGVAHAKGSSPPDKEGNIFLFAHSAVNFYEKRKFNIYFYLLGELKEDDSILISYKGHIYEYRVIENQIVHPSQIKYLGKYKEEDTVTVMTCWPVGSDYRRQLVTAVRVQDTEAL